MRRTLTHYWRMNLAVAAGAAVASAVLTGALLVGDSVKGSLRDLTLQRLGRIDHALAGQRFFPQDLARRLASDASFQRDFAAVAPAILLRGNAQHAATRARASQVSLQGVDGSFLAFFADDGGHAVDLFAGAGEGIEPPAVLNAGLARELGAAVGDTVLLSLKRWSEVPRGSLLGRKDTGNVVRTLRLRVHAILPDRGLGRFTLAAQQSLPHNVFVRLEDLQEALGQEGAVNSLLVARRASAEDGDGGEARLLDETVLDEILRRHLTPADLGLAIREHGSWLEIESSEFILKPVLVPALEQVAREAGAPLLPVMTYLVNRIERRGDGGRRVPYSTVTALDPPDDAALGTLVLTDGSPAPRLAEGEILLNGWTAEQLDAAPGDTVDLTYFVVGPQEELSETTTPFTVRGIVAMEGLGADPSLSQEYPGIAGAGHMADWDPPFPIDLGTIRGEDEEYWDRYRATPKAFVGEGVGRSLWRTRWGDVTSVRVAAPEGGDPASLRATFEQRLPELVDVAGWGLVFQPVKSLGLAASKGSSDFGGLFIGLSFFVIVAAALLAGLLFSLAVERRGGEVGLRLAVGEPPKKVRGRLLGEGLVLSALGALLGLLGAVGYAELMMAGLRTWWRPAVGTSELYLHLSPVSLGIGWAASVFVVLIAIFSTVRRITRVATPALLAGVVEPVEIETRPGRKARWTAGVSLGLAAVLLAYAVAAGRVADPAMFFGIGPALLIGLLALFALRIAGGGGRSTLAAASERGSGPPLAQMALVNSRRHRRRSLLSATLIACACFLVISVLAFQQDFSPADLGRDSGTGGFALVAESAIPLHHDLDDARGRFELGLSDKAAELLDDLGVEVTPLRLLPGDDTSCLNLYQPGRPRLLGIPHEQVERGGFSFKKVAKEVDDPWSLLEEDLGDNVIPAFGDDSSMQWILKLKLGEDLVLKDEAGEEIRLRLMGTLGISIFQSEMLISEANFRRHFPGRTGFSYFLIDAPVERSAEVSAAFEDALDPYGFDAVTGAEKLASFMAVQNTYLATFSAVGGLALLLGTVGLAVVLVRNVLERRKELATLRAFGFRRRLLSSMVVLENGLLLLLGLLIGTVAAVVTSGPYLLGAGAAAPWASLGGTLVLIYLFGLLACVVATRLALRDALLPSLKAEA